MIPQQVREVFDYSPDTGWLYWKTNGNKRTQGKRVGGNSRGYVQVKFAQKKYLAHRIAWCHFYGEWPMQMIDHIDGDRANNRIANLRDVSNAVNQHNQHALRPDNKTGVRGVHFWTCRGVYRVDMKIHGKSVYVGSFLNFPDAVAARKAAELARSRT